MARPRVRQGGLCWSAQGGTGCRSPAGRDGRASGSCTGWGHSEGSGVPAWRWEGRCSPRARAELAGGRGGFGHIPQLGGAAVLRQEVTGSQ